MVKIREQIQATTYWTEAVQNRKYKTWAMYKALIGERTHMEWKKILYTNHARPWARFTLWMTLLGKLPTKDRLTRFGIITYSNCCFCDCNEYINHLFFECRKYCSIWKDILGWFQITICPMNWNREIIWLTKETRKKGWKN